MSKIKRIKSYVRNAVIRSVSDLRLPTLAAGDAASQVQLRLHYQKLARSGEPLPGLRDVGFRTFSQTDEDGILLFLSSVIGARTRKCVEICAGDGIECNTANLIVRHGWHGLLADGNRSLVERGRAFYGQCRDTRIYPPVFVHSWITRNNVNQLIRDAGMEGEIDVLSIDMDGVDYWIWKAIDVIEPRIVVVEYQDILGPDRAITVPYRDDFGADRYSGSEGRSDFYGASLSAFVKLAREKGYRLVGCNRYGYNAFFVKTGLGERLVPEVDAVACFSHPKVVWGMSVRFPAVRDLPWVEV